jgi:23S rRNA (cytosine1962-C5)-methyltransferase
MFISQDWKEYSLLDTGDGYRLEQWGKFVLKRPDPQVIWPSIEPSERWDTPDAVYRRNETGGGSWADHNLPTSWTIDYKGLKFLVRPMNFKHTGVFPEQAVNWDAAMSLIAHAKREVKVLNLFAYTGCASVACAKAGAKVTHVDAAKGMVQWAKENAVLNGVEARWIVEDCGKFLDREIRRESKYDAIILDPPSFGRGPNGEVWHLEEQLYELLERLTHVLSDTPLFVFLNAYTTGLAPSVLKTLLDLLFTSQFGGVAQADELGLPIQRSGKEPALYLPCGATSRWMHL